MEKKTNTAAIIITIISLLLCGCPGLCGIFAGALYAVISFIPGAEIDILGSSDPMSALAFGIGGICGGLIFVLIAGVVILVSWRRGQTPPAPPEQA